MDNQFTQYYIISSIYSSVLSIKFRV